MSGTQLRDKAQSRGLSVFAFGGKEEEGCAHIALSCCEVPITDFPDAAALLRELVTQEG